MIAFFLNRSDIISGNQLIISLSPLSPGGPGAPAGPRPEQADVPNMVTPQLPVQGDVPNMLVMTTSLHDDQSSNEVK